MKGRNKYLVFLLILSAGLRLFAAAALGNEVESLPGTADQVSYHALALRVVDGFGFSFAKNWWPLTAAGAPTAHWSFLYTGYLAAIYSLVRSPLAARLLQALVVGVLHPYLAYLIGRRVFDDRTGLVAAGITAFYSYFVYYSGTLMTEPFYITAVLGVLYLAMRLAEAHEIRTVVRLSLVFGLTLGIAVLLRQLFLLLVPLVWLWIWVRRRPEKPATTFLIPLISLGVLVAAVLPFTLYNYSRFGRFVLLNTNAGYAFFLANHPVYGTDFIPAREMENYQSLVPDELKHLDEAALDSALLERGLAFVAAEPGRYLLLSLDRIPEYFRFWPSADSGLISNLSRVISFGLALPWMVVGIWIWLRGRPKTPLLTGLGAPGMLLLGFSAVYTLIHVLSWALVRYRLPVDAALIPFAGLAIRSAYDRIAAAQNLRLGHEKTAPDHA